MTYGDVVSDTWEEVMPAFSMFMISSYKENCAWLVNTVALSGAEERHRYPAAGGDIRTTHFVSQQPFKRAAIAYMIHLLRPYLAGLSGDIMVSVPLDGVEATWRML